MIRRRLLVATTLAIALWLIWPDTAYADNCSSLGDCYGTLRAALTASLGVGLFAVLLSLSLDLIPIVGEVKGIIEAISGRDLITGQELEWWERVLGIVPFAGAFIGVGASVARAAGSVDDIVDIGRTVDRVGDLAEAGRAADRVADVAETARSVDRAAEAAETARSVDRAAEAADAGRTIDRAADAADAGRTVDRAADAADAGRTAERAGNAADAGRTMDRAGEVADAGRTVDRAGDAADAGHTTDRVGDVTKGDQTVPHADQATTKVRPSIPGVGAPPGTKADVSANFTNRTYQRNGFTYEETSGPLGHPDHVVRHRDTSAQKGISSGTGDDAGHRIGDRFGAPGDSTNLAQQNRPANQFGTWKQLENSWDAKIRDGTYIDATVTDVTKPGESRPFMRRAEWTEIAPDGTVSRHQQEFMNTYTPEARRKQDVPPTVTEDQSNNVFPIRPED